MMAIGILALSGGYCDNIGCGVPDSVGRARLSLVSHERGACIPNPKLDPEAWTNEDLLNLIGQSIVDDSNADFLPLGPSSSVLIEYTVAD